MIEKFMSDPITQRRDVAIKLLEDIAAGLREGTIFLQGNTPITVRTSYPAFMAGHAENTLELHYAEVIK